MGDFLKFWPVVLRILKDFSKIFQGFFRIFLGSGVILSGSLKDFSNCFEDFEGFVKDSWAIISIKYLVGGREFHGLNGSFQDRVQSCHG